MSTKCTQYFKFLRWTSGIFLKITNKVESMDIDINNIRLEKQPIVNQYKLVFDNRNGVTLEFGDASSGTIRFFTLLNVLLYLESLKYFELILIYEVDSALNDYVLKR